MKHILLDLQRRPEFSHMRVFDMELVSKKMETGCYFDKLHLNEAANAYVNSELLRLLSGEVNRHVVTCGVGECV